MNDLSELSDSTTVAVPCATDACFQPINNQWFKDFAEWREGRFHPPRVFKFGPVTRQLVDAGFDPGEIFMATKVLNVKPIDPNHPFPVLTLTTLPKRARDPIMVFQSKTTVDALVATLDLQHDGKPLVAAFHFVYLPKLTQTWIRSVYPKEVHQIDSWISDGLLRYRKSK